jgi:hypothetical protein
MIRKTLYLLVAAALLTACGGGGAAIDSPKALADELGCADSFHATTTEELGVEAVGECEFSGQTVRLLLFANNDARDTFADVAAGFGGRYVKGDGYLVEVKGAAAEAAVKDKLG